MARGWRQNAWMLPLSAVMLAVLVYAVPQNLRHTPANQARQNESLPGLDFGLQTAHILLATVAVVTVVLNVWPWLRVRQPAVHRWSGRVYVFTALSSSLLTLPLVYLNNTWEGDLGAIATGGFWFVTTLIGYTAARRGNEPRHRRWMLYSFAMATSVVWGVVLGQFLTAPDQFPYLLELVRWVGPLVNLGAAKWWLDRTAARSVAQEVPFPAASRQTDLRAA